MSKSIQNLDSELKDWEKIKKDSGESTEKIKFDPPILGQQTPLLSHKTVWDMVEENLGRKLEKIDFKDLK